MAVLHVVFDETFESVPLVRLFDPKVIEPFLMEVSVLWSSGIVKELTGEVVGSKTTLPAF
jgi:hypothetical protein